MHLHASTRRVSLPAGASMQPCARVGALPAPRLTALLRPRCQRAASPDSSSSSASSSSSPSPLPSSDHTGASSRPRGSSSASACPSSSAPSPGLLRDSDTLELESFLRAFKARMHDGPGQVFLVGTGPGDPGLLTLRAVQLMQTADVVLYDRLVSDEILSLVHPGARMVYVGKQAGLHTRSQEEIHVLLLAFAEAGARVVRLKGGDPYVYGRGGEEVQYLRAQGIKVHCVPGITAAAGICAELGIPMTHRGVATSARFLTGHSREGGEELLGGQVVGAAADPHTTLIVYMGLQTLPLLYKQLTESGMPGSMPSVAVERGTTADQRVVFSPLSELAERTQQARLKSPTLLIIGEVVALAPGWHEWQRAGTPLEWQPEAGSRAVHPDVLADVALLQAARSLPEAAAGRQLARS